MNGKPSASGYGWISPEAGLHAMLAHRVSWMLRTGKAVPEGKLVLHTCDVRNCVRNDDEGVYVVDGIELPRYGHLFLGEDFENVRDMIAKGRWRKSSKLTIEKVREIRVLLADGESQKSIAEQYEVVPALISMIHTGRIWPDSGVTLSRPGPRRGSSNPLSKLAESDIKKIRSKEFTAGMTQAEIAAIFGVSSSAISLVLSGKTYKSLNG
jgi:DNA-binding XRE family transcriptional regulator